MLDTTAPVCDRPRVQGLEPVVQCPQTGSAHGSTVAARPRRSFGSGPSVSARPPRSQGEGSECLCETAVVSWEGCDPRGCRCAVREVAAWVRARRDVRPCPKTALGLAGRSVYGAPWLSRADLNMSARCRTVESHEEDSQK